MDTTFRRQGRGGYGYRRLRTPMAKELLQRQIDATGRQIDRLGY